MQDAFKHLDEAWHLKLAVFELMIRYELNDFDYLEHKSERIRKEYSILLKKEEYTRQKQMVLLIDKMVKSDGIKKNKQLLKEINVLLDGIMLNSTPDTDMNNCSDWLKAKVN